MAPTRVQSPPPPPPPLSSNHTPDLPRNSTSSRRTVDRSNLPIRRRHSSTPKTADPLRLLALVVGKARTPSKFLCSTCTSTFGRRCELKRHVAEVHTLHGARRFACTHPACGKSFTRKDALAKHEIVKHEGKKRFVCSTCSEKFTSRYDLTRHNVRVHSNVKKRFTCEFCAAGFSQKSQLTMHKGRVHSHAKTPNSTPLPSRPSTPDPAEGCASMDSLAAVAVAMAQQEEHRAKSTPLAKNTYHKSHCSHDGQPSQNREADGHYRPFANQSTSQEEAAAATFAAGALLEAAASLQPALTESSFTTAVTDDDAIHFDRSTAADESDTDLCISYPRTPSSIVTQ